MSILSIGEMLIDFTPVAGMNNSYTANPGGAPANVAVSVARNEIKAGFLGKLGNDDFGRMLKKTLEDNNVEMLCPELTDEATTTLAFVSLDEKGDRSLFQIIDQRLRVLCARRAQRERPPVFQYDRFGRKVHQKKPPFANCRDLKTIKTVGIDEDRRKKRCRGMC